MINKKNIKACLTLFIFIILITSSYTQYCQITKSQQSLFLLENQNRTLKISNYIQGADLDFSVNDSSQASVIQTFSKIDSINLNFTQGYSLLNYDISKLTNKNMRSSGVLVATDKLKGIQVAEAQFLGGSSLPFISNTRNPYILETNMNCFSGLITDQSFTVTVDCQNKPGQGQSLKNYLCYLKQNTTSPICLSNEASSPTSKRVTKYIQYKSTTKTTKKILSVDILPENSSQDSVINIYDLNGDQIVLQSTITKQNLKMDQLRISDVDIDNDKKKIVIASNKANHKFDLISFYYSNNNVSDIQTLLINQNGRVNSIKIEGTSYIFIATQRVLIQSPYPKVNLNNGYPLDSTDNNVVNIEMNNQFVIAMTSTNQYVWRRGNYKSQYLLHKGNIQNSLIYLQPYSNAELIISLKSITLTQITDGYLWVKGTSQDGLFSLTGRSGNFTCSVNFSVKYLKNNDGIFMKRNITEQKFTLKSNDEINLILNDYFGGKDLSYDIKKTDASFNVNIKQITKYKLRNFRSDLSFYQVVGLRPNSFYLAGVKDQILYVQTCTRNDPNFIDCQDKWKSDSLNYEVIDIDGIRRNNGQKILILCYQNQKYSYFDIQNPRMNWVFLGTKYEFSDVIIGEKFSFFAQKQDNAVSVRMNDIYTQTFGKEFLSAQQINLLGGFYPKKIRISPSNPNVFYIKTHMGIASIGVNEVDRSIRLLKYNKILQQYLNENLWDFVVGKETILIIQPQSIKEISIVEQQELHSIQLGQDLQLPVEYDKATDTVVAKTQNNKLVIFRLNSGSCDYLLYQGPFDSSKPTSLSWGWFLSPLTTDAYLIPKFNELNMKADVSDDQFKKDFQLTLKVSGQPNIQPINVNSDLIYINYPIKIKQKTDDKSSISLPSNSNDQIAFVDFPMENYFSGWINSYDVVCSFAQQKKLQLLTPLRYKSDQNYTFAGPAKDVYQGAGFTLILDQNEDIILTDQDNQQTAFLNIKDKDFNCQKITALKKDNLDNNFAFVYCTSIKTPTQMINKFSLSKDSIVFSSSYQISQELYIKTASQIKVIPQKGQNNYLIFILDVDKFTDTNSKQGTVKKISIQDDQFQSGQVISSSNFGVQPVLPINGMDIYDQNHWFVTIGGQGIGYALLNSSFFINDQKKNIKHYYRSFEDNLPFIDLKNNKDIQRYILDDNIFQSVKVISIDTAGNAKLFISSTSSLHLVLAVLLTETNPKVVNVAQTYNRMSNLPTINWAYVNKQKIVLAYYNETKKQSLIGFYRRSENGIINSQVSLILPYSENQRKNSFISMTGEKKMQVVNGDNSVGFYHYNANFSLKLNYTSPGTFNSIKFLASNGINEMSHTVDVKFDDIPSDGLKWYWVVLIIVLVLVVVGLAFGFYRKIKSKRDKKKVSLVTQGDQDQQI